MTDARTLKRQYKQTRPTMGVFLIRNQANGRVLVDGSLNLDGAMNRHRFELQQRSHRNRALQQDWLAHGPERFSFEVLERLKVRDDDAPGTDYTAALAEALVLWREEVPCHGEAGYNGPAPAAQPKENR